MTNRIGNKDEAHQRSQKEKARIKRDNIAREAIKKALVFVSTDDLRPVFGCVNMEIYDNKLVVKIKECG